MGTVKSQRISPIQHETLFWSRISLHKCQLSLPSLHMDTVNGILLPSSVFPPVFCPICVRARCCQLALPIVFRVRANTCFLQDMWTFLIMLITGQCAHSAHRLPTIGSFAVIDGEEKASHAIPSAPTSNLWPLRCENNGVPSYSFQFPSQLCATVLVYSSKRKGLPDFLF